MVAFAGDGVAFFLMRRLTVLLAAFALSLPAATLDAQYDISYAFLPSIGTTTLHYESANGRYRIDADASLHGLAAVLAHHHSEHHTSIGRVDGDGRLIPERYDTLRTMDGFRRERHYLFDRQHRYILLQEKTEKTVIQRHYDVTAMRYVSTMQTETSVENQIEPYEADEDLLSLYFNAKNLLTGLQTGETIRREAAGAEHGIVTIRRDAHPFHYTFFLDQDIFRSQSGEMEIVTDNAFHIKNAVLKDVFLFGDLKIERVWLRQSP